MSASSLISNLSASPAALAFRQEASARRAGEQPTAPSPATFTRGGDSVELSSQAQRLSQQGGDAPVRLDLVSRVRAQIAAGTYESPSKLEIAELKLRRDVRNYTA